MGRRSNRTEVNQARTAQTTTPKTHTVLAVCVQVSLAEAITGESLEVAA